MPIYWMSIRVCDNRREHQGMSTYHHKNSHQDLSLTRSSHCLSRRIGDVNFGEGGESNPISTKRTERRRTKGVSKCHFPG